MSSGGGGGITSPSGAANVYLVQPNGSGVLIFSAKATGNATPTGTLQGPAGVSLTAIATDSSGQIYLAGLLGTQTEVAVYAAGATGAAAPLRTFTFANPYEVTGIAVDAGGIIYVQDTLPEINTFAPGTTGTSVTPRGNISGSNTGMTQYPVALAVDSVHGHIYSSNLYMGRSGLGGGFVLQYPIGATGNVSPSPVEVSYQNVSYGIAVDSTGLLYTDVDQFSGYFLQLETLKLGTQSNIGEVYSGSSMGLSNDGAGALAVDSADNVYMLTQDGTTGQFGISVYPVTATNTTLTPRNSFTSTAISAAPSATVAGVLAVY